MKSRKSLWTLLATALLLLAAPLVWISLPEPEVSAQIVDQRWSYAVKFVCGFSRANIGLGDTRPGEPPISTGEATVKRGNYATEINIYNPQDRLVVLHKRVLVVYNDTLIEAQVGREPRQVQATGGDVLDLNTRFATMDDCNRIYNLVGINPGLSPPLLIGFLVVESQFQIDVSAVYTAELCSNTRDALGMCDPGNRNANFGVGMSIDVEQIEGKPIGFP